MRRICDYLTFGLAGLVLMLASGAWAQSLTPDGSISCNTTPCNISTTESINTALDAKANVADVYTKAEVDQLLAAKADQATTYTKAEVDALIAGVSTPALADLIDVAITTPSVGDLLRWDGAEWVNVTPGAAGLIVKSTEPGNQAEAMFMGTADACAAFETVGTFESCDP